MRANKMQFCGVVTEALREFGYPAVTTIMVSEIMDAWIDGKRGDELPHGVIGWFVQAQLDEVEASNPGAIAALNR